MEAHYPAICRSKDGQNFLTNMIYFSEEEARVDLGACFVRLAIEYPPLFVNPKGYVASPEAPSIYNMRKQR